MKLILMSGCPGSGKSTLARKLAKEYDAKVIAADDYFINEFGVYVFNPAMLGNAHALCRITCDNWMYQRLNVVIDNTNTTYKEMKPYLKLAKFYKYSVEVAEPTTTWRFDLDELYARNTHDVPRETIEKMLGRYESVESKTAKLREYMNEV